ncbi:glucuronate isomerase [Salmonella enterica]|nr:hypothetical protein [Salmonella enterica]EDW1089207.1 glucuronate isomerase [Salmonella enterica subsp. houtenae]ECS7581200.1 hypothetical protein [Salmonella enterica]EFS3518590.1 glucuronate isomerase [Salmonella enterica]EGK6722604.1 glucuronate isomerase [Salmonella enterica]
MTPFMTEDFLLDTEFARRLYHDYAKDQPIFDYHCHLPPQQVAENYRFKNLYDIWLKGDHYKWRAMRTNGVPERLCTGEASDREKFNAWAATVPHTIGNPLYHWTHLELRRPFGITGTLLSPATADEIWEQCNALRNNNLRQFTLLGPDVGFDSINDRPIAEALSQLLSKQNEQNLLPKTILYCLNPRDNEVIGTMIGNFQGEGMPGKMQFGSGWWFNDQKDGMERQMTQLAQLGLLSRFVGMLTDSRSFLSYTRHEYFRRILCQMIGRWVAAGEAPADSQLLGEMVKNICFNNARDYFAIELN